MLLADLEEKLKKKAKGEKILGKTKVYSLAYADDVALLADDEKGIILMMRIFEEYVGAKDLTVKVQKTRMMYFRSRNTIIYYVRNINRQTGQRVEEFCYLGFWFEAERKNELQVRKRIEWASKIMGQVLGIGKIKFKNDWRTRVLLFDFLV
ncbi:uncharacterized protein LOC117171111 [Belonocnema kinseyi]|uniref:uncharacterized protein LOC117171111 n=1 Tax=Belonocnema kinseyi TaxID=2817044 RepID=UPI00143CD712|nr:uncharacterized protein LOC117171111 [Belonocnema kinseyi]